MRNHIPVSKLLERIYVEGADQCRGVPPTACPPLLRQAVPVHEVVKVDLHVPGCPPPAQAIVFVLDELLEGRMPDLTIQSEVRVADHEKNHHRPRNPHRRPRQDRPSTWTTQGRVADTQFHVTQVRGFEKFTEGRPFYEMPSITARICGICPVSHLLASAKACDAIMAVTPPETAVLLRELLHCGQFVQSHALSFFHLSAPDLLLGMDSDPARRNIFGLIEEQPGLARDGIALRKFGQQIIEGLAKERIHPSWIVPGGVNAPLAAGSARPHSGRTARRAQAIARTHPGVLQGRARQVRRRDRPLRQHPHAVRRPGG